MGVIPPTYICVSPDPFLNCVVVSQLVQKIYDTCVIKEAIYPVPFLLLKVFFPSSYKFCLFPVIDRYCFGITDTSRCARKSL